MVIDEFVDPKTKINLKKDDKDNLYYMNDKQRIIYKNYDGIYNFVTNSNFMEEKDHYNSKYAKETLKNLTLQNSYKKWQDKAYPENLILLNSLGNLSCKKILLLGGGISFKEIYFLHLGVQLVYTDLSVEAIKIMKDLFNSSEFKEMGYENIEFHAVDALYLPFPDASFDVIYGYAFVHHIENLDQFFSEVSRCLKRGGMCRFLDGAYSPVWHLMKNTFLKPLQLYSHKRTGISPDDLKATKKGGYRKEELVQLMYKFGFKELVFERISFFQHLWRRGINKLFGGNEYLINKGTPIMARFDNFLTQKSTFMKRNLLRLVWGFNK